MAYWLQLSELDRAREIAERAVKHAGYRDEQERFNVWVGYLNLEATFGDKVEEIFKRAIPYNNAKKCYLQIAHIWKRLNDQTKTRAAFKLCCDKFAYSKKVWAAHIEWLFEISEFGEARSVLSKALERLAQKKHLQVITKTATLEYKLGERERGKTMFEGVVTSYPGRLDLWALYLDQAIKAHTPPVTKNVQLEPMRKLFERTITLNLKPFKMKFFYKRWLTFEKLHGDAEGQSNVRAAAQAFIQGLAE